MKSSIKIILIGALTLIIGLFVGGKYLAAPSGVVLKGSDKIQKTAISLNKLMAEKPIMLWEHVEHWGIFDPVTGVIVEWIKDTTDPKDTPQDLLFALPAEYFPLEYKSEEKCIWENLVCYNPPKGLKVAIWPNEMTPGQVVYHPAMPADNPEHPGIGHPDLLILGSNQEGPQEYVSDFEERYDGLVFPR